MKINNTRLNELYKNIFCYKYTSISNQISKIILDKRAGIANPPFVSFQESRFLLIYINNMNCKTGFFLCYIYQE